MKIHLLLLCCALTFGFALHAENATQDTTRDRDEVPGMALLPAGEFWMGRFRMTLMDELGWREHDRRDDRPVHLVHLDAYYMDSHEVTNADYARFVAVTGHRKPYHWVPEHPEGRERFPVYNVGWDDADAFCRWAGKRLPTEAEWERAARGGMDKKLFPWGDEFQPQAPGAENTPVRMAHTGFPNGPTEVGSYPPNAFGLYDMVGNVWEWVGDWYLRNYYSLGARRNPPGPDTGVYRVFRGGGWSDPDDRILAVHYRNYTDPSTRTPTIGFRCAKPLSEDR